jgi:hypothetical protein
VTKREKAIIRETKKEKRSIVGRKKTWMSRSGPQNQPTTHPALHSRVLRKKLTHYQLVKKLPALMGPEGS